MSTVIGVLNSRVDTCNTFGMIHRLLRGIGC